MPFDHYDALGVDPDASAAEIRSAYRQVMRRHHPDRAGDDPGSAERVRRANEAWHVLGDPERRRAYDDSRRQAQTLHAALYQSMPSAPRYPVAYSGERADFSAAFHRASVQLAAAVLVVGLVLLVLTTV